MKKVVQWSLSTKLFYSVVSNAASLLLVLWNNRNISCLTAEWKKKKKKTETLRISLDVSCFSQSGRPSALRRPRALLPRPPLAGEHQQQEQRQVPEAAEEQLPGALPVRVPVEPEA